MQYLKLSFVIGLCLLTVACNRLEPIRPLQTIEDAAVLSSTIQIGDEATDGQLMRGFHELQDGNWRWAAPKFSVVLGTPTAALKNGAWLRLECSLPDASIQAFKTITLHAKIGSLTLPPETFTTSDRHEYLREVPSTALTPGIVGVDFAVDKFLKPADDGRELALVVTAISLESK
jgi:hypothetical protein